MRFGLVGTGPWAHRVHGPGLSAAEGIELIGVYGRTRAKADQLSQTLGTQGYDDLDALLEQVDAVAFAVPPQVQADLALRAARQGKHLLLDKPVALSTRGARDLASAAQAAGIASVVFFTDRFTESGAGWFDEVSEREWLGGDVTWLANLDAPGSPYVDSAWRRHEGALWDIGPHALATLIGAIGPVAQVHAVAGRGDLVHLVLTHDNGASSTATLSLFAPSPAVVHAVSLWGPSGQSRMPSRIASEAMPALTSAAQSLSRSAESGTPQSADLGLGVLVTDLLAEAARQLGRA